MLCSLLLLSQLIPLFDGADLREMRLDGCIAEYVSRCDCAVGQHPRPDDRWHRKMVVEEKRDGSSLFRLQDGRFVVRETVSVGASAEKQMECQGWSP